MKKKPLFFVKYYIYASILLALAGMVFGLIGILFNFKELFSDVIEEKYCYFLNKEGNVERAVVGRTEQDGFYIVEWYKYEIIPENKQETNVLYFYLSPYEKVDVLEYVNKDSTLVKIRTSNGIRFASAITLHRDYPISNK